MASGRRKESSSIGASSQISTRPLHPSGSVLSTAPPDGALSVMSRKLRQRAAQARWANSAATTVIA